MLLVGSRVAEFCLPRRGALVGLQREPVRDSGRGGHHVPQEKQSRGNSIRQSVTKAIAEWAASASDLVTWLDNSYFDFVQGRCGFRNRQRQHGEQERRWRHGRLNDNVRVTAREDTLAAGRDLRSS